MKALIQLIVIALIVAGSLIGRKYLIEHAPKLPPRVVHPHVPLVKIITAKAGTHRLVVASEGVIAAPSRLSLTPEVAGRAIELGSGFKEGATLPEGALLVAIDRADYELAERAAQANLASAHAALDLELVTSDASIADWRELNKGTPPALVSRTPQLAAAKARVTTAEVSVAQAALALRRTKVQMPFTGRIVMRTAELGQRLDPAVPIALIERTDDIEVRLSLDLSELAAIGLDPSGEGASGLEIRLEADIAGKQRHWLARGARTAADLSPTNPTVTLIAKVESPLDNSGSLPVPGLFVHARIAGHKVRAIAVPHIALDIQGRLLVMDNQDRLHYREVRVVQKSRDEVLIDQGLESGERVVVVPPPVIVEGMHVALEQKDPKPAGQQ